MEAPPCSIPNSLSPEYIRYERDGQILRRKARHEVPSLSRQRGELVILRALFEQATKWGYVQALEMPGIQTRRRVDNRRPSFTPEEFERLLNTSLQPIYPNHDGCAKAIRASDGREWTQLKQNGHVLAERVKLHAYIEIAAGTGMRPTEMKNLNWGDVLGFRDGMSNWQSVFGLNAVFFCVTSSGASASRPTGQSVR